MGDQTDHSPTLPPRRRYWFAGALNRLELTPARIAAIYLLFGFAALYLSDVLFVRMFTDPFLSQLQTVKGGLEVVATGGLIYGLTTWNRLQVEARETTLRDYRDELQILHRVFRHDLRNKLNVIEGNAELLTEELDDDDLVRRCEAISESAAAIMEYSDGAANIRKLSNRDETIAIDLAETLSEIVEHHDRVDEDVGVTLDIPESAPVSVVPEFGEAIHELIDNTVEHCDCSDPEMKIEVEPDCGTPHAIELRITDNGPGIPDHELRGLRTRESDPVVHLSGLGLWFVHWAVRHSGGEIAFNGWKDDGAAIRMQLLDAEHLTSELDVEMEPPMGSNGGQHLAAD